MRRCATPLFVVALVASLLLAASPASAEPVRWRSFQTPSGNIHCRYEPDSAFYKAFLRCDILSGVQPEPSGDCELDWTGAYVERRRRAHWLCGGDTVADGGNRVLGYGEVWKRNGIRCVSRETGLRCENRSDHGFKLSRAKSRRF